MDSVKIKALLRAVEYGSLTRAADELGYTQAGLTHMMNRLETELGIPILKRSKTGVKLTNEGEKLLPYLKNFSRAAEQLDKSVSEIVHGTGEILRIGSYASILKQWIPPVINSFRSKEGNLRIEVRDSSIDDIYNWISLSEIDLAFGSKREAAGCRFIPLKKDVFYAVLPKSETRYDNRDTMSINDFNNLTFIMPTFGYDPDILNALQNNNVHPIMNATSVSDAAVAALVEMGQGCSILPELVLKSIDTNGVKIKKLTPECYRELGIILPKGKIKSPFVRSFVEHSEKVIKGMY